MRTISETILKFKESLYCPRFWISFNIKGNFMTEEQKRLREEELRNEEIVQRGEEIGDGLRKFSKTLEDGKATFARMKFRTEELRKYLETENKTENQIENPNANTNPTSPTRRGGGNP